MLELLSWAQKAFQDVFPAGRCSIPAPWSPGHCVPATRGSELPLSPLSSHLGALRLLSFMSINASSSHNRDHETVVSVHYGLEHPGHAMCLPVFNPQIHSEPCRGPNSTMRTPSGPRGDDVPPPSHRARELADRRFQPESVTHHSAASPLPRPWDSSNTSLP